MPHGDMLANIFEKIIALSNLLLSLPGIISLPLPLSLLPGIIPLSLPLSFSFFAQLRSRRAPSASSHTLSLSSSNISLTGLLYPFSCSFTSPINTLVLRARVARLEFGWAYLNGLGNQNAFLKFGELADTTIYI